MRVRIGDNEVVPLLPLLFVLLEERESRFVEGLRDGDLDFGLDFEHFREGEGEDEDLSLSLESFDDLCLRWGRWKW